MTDRYFSAFAGSTAVIEIFEIGASEPTLQFVRDASIIGWGNMREIIAHHYEVDEDQVESVDLYWGGENHDENTVDGIMVDRRLVATFGRTISHSEALAIALTQSNNVAYIADGSPL